MPTFMHVITILSVCMSDFEVFTFSILLGFTKWRPVTRGGPSCSSRVLGKHTKLMLDNFVGSK